MLPKPLPKHCYAVFQRVRKNSRVLLLRFSKCYALKLLEPYLSEEEFENLKKNYTKSRIRFPVGVRAYENADGHLVIEIFPAKSSYLSLHKGPGGVLEIKLRKVLRAFDLSRYRQVSHYLIHERGNAYVIFPKVPDWFKEKYRRYFDTPSREKGIYDLLTYDPTKELGGEGGGM